LIFGQDAPHAFIRQAGGVNHDMGGHTRPAQGNETLPERFEILQARLGQGRVLFPFAQTRFDDL
jgi:hypothetical protein